MIQTFDLMLVQVRYYVHDQRNINTFAYQLTEAPVADVREDLAAEEFNNAFDTLITAAFINCQAEEAINHFVRSQVYRVQAPEDVRFAYREKAMTPQEGQIAGDALPTGCCAVIRKMGLLAGQTHRGRIFLGGVPTSAEEDSHLEDAYMTLLTVLANKLDDDITPTSGAVWTPVIISGDKVERDFIVSTSLDQIIRYQRRREVGVGE